MSYSSKFGKDYITGFCDKKELTLIIDRIINVEVEWIHNYPLNRLFEFGLIFAFPVLLLYLYLLSRSIIQTIRSDNHNIYNIGFYLLIIPFIISMAEPTFPFGPGTATVFNYIIFGVALRYSYDGSFG